jgi:very-short-patch-repair endonuclease
MNNEEFQIINHNNLKFFKYENEFWFSQKTISMILDVKSHTINWHLKEIEKINTNFKVSEFKITQIEGNRKVSRNIKHYPLECLFDISMRCNKLNKFNDIIEIIKEEHEVNLDFQVRPIKETNFKEILKKALFGIVSFEYQYRVNGYIIDLYFPEIDLCIEYDEQYHKYQLDKDKSREENIKKCIGCNFLRVNEGEELKALNRIIELTLEKLYIRRAKYVKSTQNKLEKSKFKRISTNL